jgi:hypothetical protein
VAIKKFKESDDDEYVSAGRSEFLGQKNGPKRNPDLEAVKA